MSVQTEDTGTTTGNIPHQAVIPISAEIMERLPTGHVSGKVLKRVSHVFTVFGNSLKDCTERTEGFIEAIRHIPTEIVEKIREEAALEEYETQLTTELQRVREQLTNVREQV
tara:strand:+ start:48 stop:383 length:336 start_codon:yes stop_codon:yes gene_type:complete